MTIATAGRANSAIAGRPFVALTTHAREVAADDRAAFAAALHQSPPPGAIVVETCHRVEAYLPGAASGVAVSSLPVGGRVLRGGDAVRHAISVAIGLDSVAVGEDQILHQVRRAVTDARTRGGLDAALERLFDVALRAGRRARSWRQGRPRSLADVAVSELQRRAGRIDGRQVLVVGSGQMGSLAARALARAGARTRIASRNAARAAALARAVAGTSVALDAPAVVEGIEAVVIAFRSAWPADPSVADSLDRGSAIVVDLSVPSAVPSELGKVLGGRLIDADDLARLEQSTDLPSGPDRARLERLLDDTQADFAAWLAASDARQVAESLADRAERERLAELEALWARLPSLEPEVRAVIEGMSRHLARRLLRDPMERLANDPDGRRERAVREAFGL